MPLSVLRFKAIFMRRDVYSQRHILSVLADRMQAAVAAAGAASTASDLSTGNIVRGLTCNMDVNDLNSICNAGAFVWTQLLESDSPAFIKALAEVLGEL